MNATIINVPSSTKNTEKSRDPDMQPDQEGPAVVLRHEGTRGVDTEHKVIHAVVATAAKVADSAVLPDLLHGQETRVYGDQAYRGQGAVIGEYAPQARDFTNRRCRGRVDEVQRPKNQQRGTSFLTLDQLGAVARWDDQRDPRRGLGQ